MAAQSATVSLPPNGTPLNAAYDPYRIGYTVRNVIYGNDLATDMNTSPVDTVPFGLVMNSAANDVVVAIRGTEGIWEWMQDFVFLQKKCPFLNSGGNTEDGFTDVYTSLTVDQSGQSVVNILNNWPQPINTLTICGHSLGGALATLLALDVGANTKLTNKISVYTYASPKVGDETFVNTYNGVVPSTVRIANRSDIVPKLPLPPLYDHVAGLYELNPVSGQIVLIDPTIPCEHNLTSYLYLLSLLPGATVSQPLSQQCLPPANSLASAFPLFNILGAIPAI